MRLIIIFNFGDSIMVGVGNLHCFVDVIFAVSILANSHESLLMNSKLHRNFEIPTHLWVHLYTSDMNTNKKIMNWNIATCQWGITHTSFACSINLQLLGLIQKFYAYDVMMPEPRSVLFTIALVHDILTSVICWGVKPRIGSGSSFADDHPSRL